MTDPRWAVLEDAARKLLSALAPIGVDRIEFVTAWPDLNGVEPWLVTASDAAADAVRDHPGLHERVVTLLRSAGLAEQDLADLRVEVQSQETVDRDYEGSWFHAMR